MCPDRLSSQADIPRSFSALVWASSFNARVLLTLAMASLFGMRADTTRFATCSCTFGWKAHSQWLDLGPGEALLGMLSSPT